MRWQDFFKLSVMIARPEGARPYFNSVLTVKDKFEMSDLLISRFDCWRLTLSESKRLTMDLRKILYCHRYFNSKEFDRVFRNFMERLSQEKSQELKFATFGGGVYLFLAVMKHQGQELAGKTIICETSEIPLPVVRLPRENRSTVRLIYRPAFPSYFAGFPSLWARPEIIHLFDRKIEKSDVA